jgi:hypothetical protein
MGKTMVVSDHQAVFYFGHHLALVIKKKGNANPTKDLFLEKMAQFRQRVPTCHQNIAGILIFSNIFYDLWLSPLISSITCGL